MPNNGVLLIANPDTLRDLYRILKYTNIRVISRFYIPRGIILMSNNPIVQDLSNHRDILEHANKALSQGYDAVLIKIRPRVRCRKILNKIKHALSIGIGKILSLFIPDVCKSDEFLFEVVAFRHEAFRKLLSCCLAFSSSIITSELSLSGLKIYELNLDISITDEVYDKVSFRDILTRVLEVLKQSDYRPLKFALVGSIGVVVNEGMLFLLHGILALPVFIAGLLAIESSIINNFTLHEIWTFRKKILSRDLKSKFIRFGKYHIAVGVGALVNYVVLVLLNILFGMSYDANLIGIALGFLANYLISDRFVWKRKKGQ